MYWRRHVFPVFAFSGLCSSLFLFFYVLSFKHSYFFNGVSFEPLTSFFKFFLALFNEGVDDMIVVILCHFFVDSFLGNNGFIPFEGLNPFFSIFLFAEL